MLNKNNKMTFICLLITVLLDQMGLFLIAPIIPQLLESINHDTVANNVIIGGWLIATYGLMQFFMAPIIGAISDRFGRKPVLIICFIGFALDYLLFAIASNIYLLFVARIISGITGSSLAVSMAGVADISDDKNKTKNYAYLNATIFIGMILGPVVSSFSVRFGVHKPFIIASSLCILSLLMTIIFYKETLAKENRRPFKIINPIASLKFSNSSKNLLYLFIAYFLLQIAVQAPLSLWPFFTALRFNWSGAEIANSFTALGVLMFIVQIFFVPKVYPILGNKKTTYLGFTMFATGLTLLAFAYNTWIFYLSIIPYAFATISNSTMMTIYSSMVEPTEQGKLMGTLSSMSSICAVIGPIIATYCYNFSLKLNMPFSDGYPFLYAAIIVVSCIWFLKIGILEDKKID